MNIDTYRSEVFSMFYPKISIHSHKTIAGINCVIKLLDLPDSIFASDLIIGNDTTAFVGANWGGDVSSLDSTIDHKERLSEIMDLSTFDLILDTGYSLLTKENGQRIYRSINTQVFLGYIGEIFHKYLFQLTYRCDHKTEIDLLMRYGYNTKFPAFFDIQTMLRYGWINTRDTSSFCRIGSYCPTDGYVERLDRLSQIQTNNLTSFESLIWCLSSRGLGGPFAIACSVLARGNT
jgi:hypothetical protein